MIKKKYTKPIVKVAQTQYQSHLLTVSNTSTTGLDQNLNYDKNGGDQENAW